MCEGQSRALTATPAPALGGQFGSGDSGSFSGTGVSGTTFTAPTPAGDSQTYTITYTFGYCSTTQGITVFKNPSTANAGSDQTVCTSSTTLGATAPAVGVGEWSVASGPGTVTSVFNPNSTITGLVPGMATVLNWTVSNGPCTSSVDQMVIIRESNPTPSNAGSNQSVCSSSATLAANTPSVGTGAWSLVGGSGTITDTGNPNSTVTGLGFGTNTFRWTTTNGVCPPSTDDVVITRNMVPTAANAGPDQTVCDSATTLAANTPTVGTGSWSILAGSGSVTTSSDPNSTITGLAFGSPATLEWLISNGVCPGSRDTVIVSREDNDPPSITCPGMQYATVDSFCNNELADYTGLASVSDNCGTVGVTVTQIPAAGTTVNSDTQVMLIATDGAGNGDTCSFWVRLVPQITHFTSRTDSQWRVNWEYSATTPNDTNFRIRYWEQGFPAAFSDHSQFPSNFQKKITGLESNTWYDVKVGFACADGNFIWGNTESVRTKKIKCPTPTNAEQDLPASETIASVTWDDQGATSYKFRYRPIGSSDWNYSTISSTTKSMGGLTPGTPYHFQLKALCTTGLWSSYTAVDTFVTAIPPGVEGGFRMAATENEETFAMEIYPNPNNGLFTIDLEGKLVNTVIEVRSLKGELVGSFDLRDMDVMSVDLTHLTPGVYMVNAISDGNRIAQVEKLIIN